MPTFYVATLARYVLVEADDEAAARQAAKAPLQQLHAELSARIGRDAPVEIRTVRLATEDEIEFCRWGEETLAREASWRAQHNRA